MEDADDTVSEAALAAALESSGGVGFWMWDILKDDARADPVTALLFNLSPARSRAGVSLSEIMRAVHPDDQPHITQVILDCVRAGGSYTAEYRVCSPEGRLRWLFTRGHFYLDGNGRPIRGTLVETYLRERGITNLHDTGHLGFHPRCYYRADDMAPTKTWPAMIAAVTDARGTVTGAHRTWLDPERHDKAPIETPRRAMGDLLGNAVNRSQSPKRA